MRRNGWTRRQWRKWVGDGQEYEENVRWRRKVMRSGQVFFVAWTVLIPPASGFYFMVLEWPATGGPIALWVYFQLFAFLGFAACRTQAQNLEAEIRTIDFENKIRDVERENEDQREDGAASTAINFFLKNEVELKRYYEQALRQSWLVFLLGVVCVLAGLGAVTGAGAAVLLKSDQESQQVVLGVLGAVGALLSGFVARVYLGLHRDTASSLAQFHNRFVLTHHLLFANVLVSEIDEKRMRNETLQQVAAGIARGDRGGGVGGAGAS